MESVDIVAGGYVEEGLAGGQRAQQVFGCAVLKNGAGDFLVTLDQAMGVGSAPAYGVAITPVKASTAAGISAIISGPVPGQFAVALVDDVHVAIDAGFFLAIYPLPKTH